MNTLFLFLWILSIHGKTSSSILSVDMSLPSGARWLEGNRNEDVAVRYLVQLLERGRIGEELLELTRKKAQSQGKTIFDIIRPGHTSITNTTLTRRFSLNHPDRILYETHSSIVIDRNLTVINALLDLAHELIHYVHRAPFNPYDENFTMKEFIHSTVEGKGGEVDAYLTECRVLNELFPGQTEHKSNCGRIRRLTDGVFSKKLAVKEFYQLGIHMDNFMHQMTVYRLVPRDFPHISGKQALFISSAHGLPYPLAAVKEYASILNTTCQNDFKRLSLFKSRRNPAVSDPLYLKLKRIYRTRCVLEGNPSL